MTDRPTPERMKCKTADELLRELFYMRTPLGSKLEEMVAEINPELWRQCYAYIEDKQELLE